MVRAAARALAISGDGDTVAIDVGDVVTAELVAAEGVLAPQPAIATTVATDRTAPRTKSVGRMRMCFMTVERRRRQSVTKNADQPFQKTSPVELPSQRY